MRWLNVILVALLWATTSFLTMAAPVTLSASEVSPSKEVDVAHMLFGHIGDSYGWHITDWSGKHVTIPLPCIVYSKQSGWHMFMSSKIEHGHQYEGLYLSEDGAYKDKIVELGADGQEVRPFDISITKNVASLMFTAVLLILLVLGSARWYKKHDAIQEGAPKGVAEHRSS